jgi:hypothetical protein
MNVNCNQEVIYKSTKWIRDNFSYSHITYVKYTHVPMYVHQIHLQVYSFPPPLHQMYVHINANEKKVMPHKIRP